MQSVTHLEQVRAEIRVAWPSGIVCPPLLVRWRAGSEPTRWGTLLELARVRAEHPGTPILENLTRAVAVDLVAHTESAAGIQAAKHLVAGVLSIVGTPGQTELVAVDAYLSGAA